MSVLVTGGAGYIGSHTALELLDKGEEVVILDDLSTGLSQVVPSKARFVEGDIGDEPLLARLVRDHRIDAIIHFAAKAIVPDSVADPLLYYRENTSKTRNLVAAAVEAGVPHVIFSSTSAVYGNPVSIPMREDGPTEPVSPYGRSKLMCEHILSDVAAATPLRYAALRYFNVAGADPEGRSGQSTKRATHLIKVAVQAALGERDGIEVYGTDYPTPDGSCIRDYIHVTDLARGHLAALDHLRRGGESLVLNCGYGRGYSVLEVLEVVKRVSGVDFPVKLSGRRAGDPAVTVAASDAIREKLGWTPEFDDLETIVRHAYAWEKRLAAGELAQKAPVI